MFSKKSLKKGLFIRKRQADVTIEYAVGSLLGIIVLILVIGMFGDNLKGLATSARSKNLYSNEKITSYVTNKDDIDYNGSLVNVQTIGDQGVNLWRQIAITKIKTIGAKDDGQMSEAERNKLAMFLTIYGALGNGKNTLDNNSSCLSARTKNDIEVDYKQSKTIIGETEIDWTNDYSDISNTPSNKTDENRLKNVSYITERFGLDNDPTSYK